MATTFAQVVNKINCGGSGVRGTGNIFCDTDVKSLAILGFTRKNKSLASTTVIGASVYTDMIQKEEMTIVKGLVSTSDVTSGNEYQTYETGVKKLTNKNPYEIEVTLNKGIHNYKAINTLESNALYDVWMFDEKNDCFIALNKDGSIRGLDCLMVTVENYKVGKENSYLLRFQIDRNDFDNNLAVIKAENLGFEPKRTLDGYNDIDIRFITPSAGLTVVLSTWAHNNNKHYGLFGMDAGDLRFEKATISSGVVTGWSVITGITLAATGSANDPDYTASFPSPFPMVSGDKYRVKTFDSSLNSDVIYVEGNFYKSYNPANENYFEFTVL